MLIKGAKMSNRSYKSDTSFRDKIALGAVGTRFAYKHLRELGHKVIELERGSLNAQIWSNVKIKRIRVPDLFCMACGTMVEVRAKNRSSFEFSMSHSTKTAERHWDYGLSERDYVAFVPAMKDPESELGWSAHNKIYYVPAASLKEAVQHNKIKIPDRKGAEEGSESRIVWPIKISNVSGKVISISESFIIIDPNDGSRKRKYKLTFTNDDKTFFLRPLVSEGDSVEGGDVIASIVQVFQSIPCQKRMHLQEHLEVAIGSESLPEKYAAIKALGYYRLRDKDLLQTVTNSLFEIASNASLHPYIQLEAAASLVRLKDNRGYSTIKQFCLADNNSHRLEAALTLAELPSQESVRLLGSLLSDSNAHPEVRIGASWALGRIGDKDAIETLIAFLADKDRDVRLSVARAIGTASRRHLGLLIQRFTSAETPDAIQGLAWSIANLGGAVELARHTIDNPSTIRDNQSVWVAFALAHMDPESHRHLLDALGKVRPDIFSNLFALRAYLNSWVADLK